MKDMYVIDISGMKKVGKKGLDVIKMMTGYTLAEKGAKLLSAKTQRIEDQLRIAKQRGLEAGERLAYQDILIRIVDEDIKTIEDVKEWISKQLQNKESGD